MAFSAFSVNSTGAAMIQWDRKRESITEEARWPVYLPSTAW